MPFTLPPLKELLELATLALVLAGLTTWAHLWFWVRRLSLRLDYSLSEELATEDGSAIELRRIPLPAGTAPSSLPPVLLVHGISANHRNQDLHPRYSMARHLAGIGRDVWLVTLRSGRQTRWRERKLLSFEAMARHDLPLAVAEILRRTGAKQLDFIGFSMGGMLLYAALGRSLPEASLRRVALIGSPGFIATKYVPRVAGWVPMGLIPRVPLRFGARLIAFLSEWFTTPFHRMVTNPLNIAGGLTRVALVDLIQDIPGRLLADFIGWSSSDGVIRVGGVAVLDGLERITIPAFFAAGAADEVAPVPTVRHAFEQWGKATPGLEKRFVVLGCAYGSTQDYGHGDLCFGVRVGEELFGPVAAFLG